VQLEPENRVADAVRLSSSAIQICYPLANRLIISGTDTLVEQPLVTAKELKLGSSHKIY
jgi:hypothetical protein